MRKKEKDIRYKHKSMWLKTKSATLRNSCLGAFCSSCLLFLSAPKSRSPTAMALGVWDLEVSISPSPLQRPHIPWLGMEEPWLPHPKDEQLRESCTARRKRGCKFLCTPGSLQHSLQRKRRWSAKCRLIKHKGKRESSVTHALFISDPSPSRKRNPRKFPPGKEDPSLVSMVSIPPARLSTLPWLCKGATYISWDGENPSPLSVKQIHTKFKFPMEIGKENQTEAWAYLFCQWDEQNTTPSHRVCWIG